MDGSIPVFVAVRRQVSIKVGNRPPGGCQYALETLKTVFFQQSKNRLYRKLLICHFGVPSQDGDGEGGDSAWIPSILVYFLPARHICPGAGIFY